MGCPLRAQRWDFRRKRNEVEVDIGTHNGDGVPADGGRVIREELIKYMADTLRDLPDQQRVFLHLPRARVGTEWSQWMDHAQPTTHGNNLGFTVGYVFYPGGEWDASTVCERLQQLWRMWGWTATLGLPPVGDGYTLVGRSYDGYEFTLYAAPQRRGSSLEIVSPHFDPGTGNTRVTMPFAVTPFGELSLPQIWATHPELVKW